MTNQRLALPFEGARSQAREPVGGFPPKGYTREMPTGIRSPVERAPSLGELLEYISSQVKNP